VASLAQYCTHFSLDSYIALGATSFYCTEDLELRDDCLSNLLTYPQIDLLAKCGLICLLCTALKWQGLTRLDKYFGWPWHLLSDQHPKPEATREMHMPGDTISRTSSSCDCPLLKALHHEWCQSIQVNHHLVDPRMSLDPVDYIVYQAHYRVRSFPGWLQCR
jgi:hypothetical protein